MAECAASLIFRPEYTSYDFGPHHPLRPERMRASLDLLAALELNTHQRQLPPATSDELRLIHDAAYIQAVETLDTSGMYGKTPWGPGPSDTPAFSGMHQASALIAGGSIHAVRSIFDGHLEHAFNPAGGLHHAMRDRASGFCVYNDPALAIAAVLAEHDARVLYLDFDVHHGDGVQAAFYADPRVLTLSIHETGRYLFPGTGYPDEIGRAAGTGYSVNLPVQPYTEDDSWLQLVNGLVPRIAEAFAPDLIVSQHGCDSHAWDPISHVCLSTRAYAAQARLVHELAHRLAGGRWLATGGGGYDWARVVPRSWALIWSEMSGQMLPSALPQAWLDRWRGPAEQADFTPMPRTFDDDTSDWPLIEHRSEIERANQAMADELRRQLGSRWNL
jgi:acetoin utilization protein AcuC